MPARGRGARAGRRLGPAPRRRCGRHVPEPRAHLPFAPSSPHRGGGRARGLSHRAAPGAGAHPRIRTKGGVALAEPTPSSLPADRLVAAASADGSVRVTALTLTHAVEEARTAHATLPVATAALGRAMAAGLLLAHALLKEPDRLTLRLLGDGPLGAVVVDASPAGDVRGYVAQPRVMLPPTPAGKLDVGRAVGRRGVLHVSHDSGIGRPYTGSVPLVSGEVGEDVAHYLTTSLQVPSAVAVGVRVGTGGVVLGAAGVLVQRLPGADEAAVADVEAALSRLGPVSQVAAAGGTAQDLLAAALAHLGHGAVAEVPLAWRCTCSRERTARLLAALGAETLDGMIADDGGAELTCHFCGAVYRFDAAELKALGAESNRSAGDDEGRPVHGPDGPAPPEP
ncbi:MAG: Hsp33 family molecular chaperone HslO [Firmicutes bacterium]|nr:Hsp33 family molecular chaperone HslO [Bacillota bacterium]